MVFDSRSLRTPIPTAQALSPRLASQSRLPSEHETKLRSPSGSIADQPGHPQPGSPRDQGITANTLPTGSIEGREEDDHHEDIPPPPQPIESPRRSSTPSPITHNTPEHPVARRQSLEEEKIFLDHPQPSEDSILIDPNCLHSVLQFVDNLVDNVPLGSRPPKHQAPIPSPSMSGDLRPDHSQPQAAKVSCELPQNPAIEARKLKRKKEHTLRRPHQIETKPLKPSSVQSTIINHTVNQQDERQPSSTPRQTRQTRQSSRVKELPNPQIQAPAQKSRRKRRQLVDEVQESLRLKRHQYGNSARQPTVLGSLEVDKPTDGMDGIDRLLSASRTIAALQMTGGG